MDEAWLLEQVHAIAKETLTKREGVEHAGLLSGKAGISVMLAHLSVAFPDEYGEALVPWLDDLGAALASDELDHTMSSGVGGIAYVFQHCRNLGLLDTSDDMNLGELDAFLDSAREVDRENGNWDPLHGVTGQGVYFLERHTETRNATHLESIVDTLSSMRVEHRGHRIWVTPGSGSLTNNNYNFGMAHGIPGVVAFLAQVHARGIRPELTAEMIDSSLGYLLGYEDAASDVSSFPMSIDVGHEGDVERHARHAWCYGDLGVANALLHAGKALARPDWRARAIAIARMSTKRTFDTSGVRDAGFCHGTVGVAHQYERIHQVTGDPEWRVAADRWLSITRDRFYVKGQGAGGYLSQQFDDESNSLVPETSYGLLEGSAGIALAYLTRITGSTSPWDSVFFTNLV